MKYVYEPNLLKVWVRDNKQFLKTEFENVNKKYGNRLEQLKEQLAFHQDDLYEISKWMENLSKKDRLLLPNLYTNHLPAAVKKLMLIHMHQTAKQDRRFFRVIIDTMYTTADFNDIWNIVKTNYAAHQERIEKRLDKQLVPQWRAFIQASDPALFLISAVLTGETNIEAALKPFYLTRQFAAFDETVVNIFKTADEALFQQEQKLFQELFTKAVNKNQQAMAQQLIEVCQLNTIRPLGKLIYEKLKIYTRQPMLWNEVGETEKKRFARWVMKQELKNFFGDININHERFIYWEKFVHKLEDVVITDNKSTLIMYFPDAVVMEILGTGAVYVYNRFVFNRYFQPFIEEMLDEREKYQNSFLQPRDLKRSSLMDQDLAVYRLIHVGGWQYKFDSWLKQNLNWEVRKDVLQAEAKRDEGAESGSW